MKYLDNTIEKVNKLISAYEPYIIEKSKLIHVEIAQPTEQFFEPSTDMKFKKIEIGEKWGSNFSYAWFKLDLSNLNELGDEIYILNKNGATENLVFVDECPYGMFDDVRNVVCPEFRQHRLLRLPKFNQANPPKVFFEGYASHTYYGTMPYSDLQTFSIEGYEPQRVYEGVYAVKINRNVERLFDNLSCLQSLYSSVKDSFLRAKLQNVYQEIYSCIDLMPREYFDENSVKKTNDIIEHALESLPKSDSMATISMVGHSHLDTAWLWTIDETKRKLARTVSTAVRLLELFPNYIFALSSVIYLEWLRDLYPKLYVKVKKYIKEGRLEIVGANYVECDCNLVSGESFIRQIKRGQIFLRENFGFENKLFWMPDTFGYSASMPQIMKKCNLEYFLTSKLSWNDCNKFPYDTFNWTGIDGTTTLTHFISIHTFPSPKAVIERAENLPNKNLSSCALLTYGFGDGGGGASEKMVESAMRMEHLNGIPKCKHQRVDEFMATIDTTRLPSYNGELYLEMHRGTLTTNHRIKKLNRNIETALYNFELLDVAFNADENTKKQMNDNVDLMLLNQFHDILPGTSINEVNDTVFVQNENVLKSMNEKIKEITFNKEEKLLTVYNTLPFDRTENISIDEDNLNSECSNYRYTGQDGKEKVLFENIKLNAFSSIILRNDEKPNKEHSPFISNAKTLETPYYFVRFNEDMEIASLVDKRVDRECVGTTSIGKYVMYDDVPLTSDNWEIDYDYKTRFVAKSKLLESSVIISTAYTYAIRNKYKICNSIITQDIIFYANSPQIKYENRVDFDDKYKLLKVLFDTNILTTSIKSEIQFGYIERKNHANNSIEIAQYEFCNQKWSDISENKYGIAIINDCKYGLGADGGEIGLTLIKSTCRPDTRAEKGTHYFNFAVLPHNCAFDASSVVIPAYCFNNQPIVENGRGKELNIKFQTNSANIILEAMRKGDIRNSVVLRLYESERVRCKAEITVDEEYKSCFLANMLEDVKETIQIKEGKFNIEFAPFEIKTIILSKEC